MPLPIRRLLAVGLLLFCAADTAIGQSDLGDMPKPYESKTPPTREEVSRRDALKQYVLGLLCERDERLNDALSAYEKAARLDPESATVIKAQLPILVFMGRGDDAVKAARAAVDLDPADIETWHLLAKLYRSVGNTKEALACLRRAEAVAALKYRPELAHQVYYELATLLEQTDEALPAATAFTRAAETLDHLDPFAEFGQTGREQIAARAADSYERAGQLYLKMKKFDEASSAFRQAQQHDPDGAARLNFNLAQIAKEQGKLDQALTHLDAYLRLQPLGDEPYQLKIAILKSLGKKEAILPWLEQVTTADSTNVRLKLLLASQLTEAKQLAKAEAVYAQLISESPTPGTYVGLFRLYKSDPEAGPRRMLMTIDDAFAQSAKKDAPRNSSDRVRAIVAAVLDDPVLAKDIVDAAFRKQGGADDKLDFETSQLLAMLADKQHRLADAESFYRRSLGQATPLTEARAYSGLLRVLWRQKKIDEVIDICRSGLRNSQATNFILFYSELAKAYTRQNQWDDALREADRALRLVSDVDRLAIERMRVRILVLAERYDDAEKECQELLKEFFSPAAIMDIRYLLSNVYSARKDNARAEEQLKSILAMEPDNPSANNDLGYIWADQDKNLEQAEAMVRKAIDVDRRERERARLSIDDDIDNAAYIDSLGWVLFRKGDFAEARRQLEKAVTLDNGDDAILWDHLGDVCRRQGDVVRARAAWTQSLTLFETQNRRNLDERYHEVERKLKALAVK